MTDALFNYDYRSFLECDLQEGTPAENEDSGEDASERCGPSLRLPNPIIEAVEREWVRLRIASIRHSKDQLHLLLGGIVEDDAVLSDTATIFLAVRNCKLRSVATVNLNRPELVVSFEDRGIVPAVARLRVDRFVSDVRFDLEYFRDDSKTISELAIQVESFDGRLLGVINLEFWRPQTEERLRYIRTRLQPRLADIALHLLVLQELSEGGRQAVAWHPEIHGWDLEDVMNRICHRISQSIDRDLTKTTMWYADLEKDSAHVYATSGGAFAYKCERTLPLSDSVLGSHIQNGTSAPVEYNPEVDLNKNVPPSLTASEGWLFAFCPNRTFTTGEPGRAALVVTFTGHDCELIEESCRANVKASLPKIASRIRSWLERFPILRRRIVATRLLYNISMDKPQKFELVLQSALTSLSSPAGTLFAVRADPRRLEVVATTGLLKSRGHQSRHGHLPTYSLDSDSNLTVFAANRPEKPIRLNDTSSLTEFAKEGIEKRPSAKIRETLLSDDLGSRRFLAASETLGDSPVVVIRIVRSMSDKPFTACDSDLLACIAKLGALVVGKCRVRKTLPSRQEILDVLYLT